MKSHENAPTERQKIELLATTVKEFPLDVLSAELTQYYIEHPKELGAVLGTAFTPVIDVVASVAGWKDMYESAGVVCDTSSLVVPIHRPGFDRLIVVPKGLKSNRVVIEIRKEFNVWTYCDNLDAVITHNDREPTKIYAVWVRDRIEADEELKNKSADELARADIKGITLLERLVLEWKYFSETGKHLDVENFTLCSGSRYGVGGVPGVGWYSDDRGLCVDWYFPGPSVSNIRGRAVVSRL